MANSSDAALLAPPSGTEWVLILSALALITVVAAVFGFWALRRLRAQRARAEVLADNIGRIRDDLDRRRNFLNAISHDLRTPLNGITLQTHVVERAIAQNDAATLRLAAGEMRQSAALAAEILDALLRYARVDLDPNLMHSLPLRDVLLRAAEPFRAAAEEKSLTFEFDVPGTLNITTDRAKLERIITSLLDNAVKFTPHGAISLRVHGSNLLDAPRVIVEVADTGQGISPEDQRKVFREFFQANNPSRDARRGLGLGLVIAQRLARQLGGNITCDSTLNQGTIFQVTLPIDALWKEAELSHPFPGAPMTPVPTPF